MSIDKTGQRNIRVVVKPVAETPIPFEIGLTGEAVSALSVSYSTREDGRSRSCNFIDFYCPGRP